MICSDKVEAYHVEPLPGDGYRITVAVADFSCARWQAYHQELTEVPDVCTMLTIVANGTPATAQEAYTAFNEQDGLWESLNNFLGSYGFPTLSPTNSPAGNRTTCGAQKI